MNTNEGAADAGGPPTTTTTDLILPGLADIYACGEWAQRYEGDWRDSIDLATADRVTVYAAGQADGYRQAWVEIGALHTVLVDWLEIMQIECLERCTCGRKLRHPHSGADGFYPACREGWSV